MPPGPLFNWFCVLHSAVDICVKAAEIRATQINPRTAPLTSSISGSRKRKRRDAHCRPPQGDQGERRTQSVLYQPAAVSTNTGTKQCNPSSEETYAVYRTYDASASASRLPSRAAPPTNDDKSLELHSDLNTSSTTQDVSAVQTVDSENSAVESDRSERQDAPEVEENAYANERAFAADSLTSSEAVYPEDSESQEVTPIRTLQSSKVPSSRIGRFFHYGGLAASLGYGAAAEILRRSTHASEDSQYSSSLMMTEANVSRLVSKLSKMRGAALKLGQFMSIQDSHFLPPEIEEIFRRVQDSAHYMPDWQMEQVLVSSLGPLWSSHFETFDRIPFAAASIGQVHTAVLAPSSSPSGTASPVAVKVQFPNIRNSIESDLGYIKLLLTAGRLLPKGLFLDRTIKVMKEELADECSYTREASFLRRFGSSSHLGSDARFKVPWVWEGSTDNVLVMERVRGVSVGGSMVDKLNQQDRNDIASRIIELCLKELFVFRLMQTDPNWTNFLWNGRTRQIELVDFGATREYSKEFIDSWLRILQAAASEDRNACIEWSLKLGYLTGNENEIMLDAHVQSMQLLATPFKDDTPQPFNFGRGTQWADITAQIRAQIPVMLKYRLTPPPRETYSLNRKLSGAFLLASRLSASVDCKAIWDSVVDNYRFNS